MSQVASYRMKMESYSNRDPSMLGNVGTLTDVVLVRVEKCDHGNRMYVYCKLVMEKSIDHVKSIVKRIYTKDEHKCYD
jgi:hypothetical protein